MEFRCPMPDVLSSAGPSAQTWHKLQTRLSSHLFTYQPDTESLSIFYFLAGPQIQALFNSLAPGLGRGKSKEEYSILIKQLLCALEKICLPKLILLFHRFQFFTFTDKDVSKDGSSLISYLSEKADLCEFGDQKEALIRKHVASSVDEPITEQRFDQKEILKGQKAPTCWEECQPSGEIVIDNGVFGISESIQLDEGQSQLDAGQTQLSTLYRSVQDSNLFFLIGSTKCQLKVQPVSNESFGRQASSSKTGQQMYSNLDWLLSNSNQESHPEETKSKLASTEKSSNFSLVDEQVLQCYDKQIGESAVLDCINSTTDTATDNLEDDDGEESPNHISSTSEKCNERVDQTLLNLLDKSPFYHDHASYSCTQPSQSSQPSSRSSSPGPLIDTQDTSPQITNEDINTPSSTSKSASVKVNKANEKTSTGDSVSKKDRVVCDVCGKDFKSLASLRCHVRTNHRELNYTCDTCGKAFAYPCLLRSHQRLHTKERPYSCVLCGATFPFRSYVYNHMRDHMFGKTFQCPHCPQKFFQKSTMKIHIAIHTGERPYVCKECGKGYRDPYSLLLHSRSHTGERPYKCETCSRGFNTRSMMRRHETVHTGVKPYACTLCHQSFTRLGSLNCHKTHTHGIVN